MSAPADGRTCRSSHNAGQGQTSPVTAAGTHFPSYSGDRQRESAGNLFSWASEGGISSGYEAGYRLRRAGRVGETQIPARKGPFPLQAPVIAPGTEFPPVFF